MEYFRRVRRLANHWARPGGGPENRAFYWYLTVSHSQRLRDLAEQCQKELPLPYYDFTPLNELHLTLNRVAFENSIRTSDLDAVIAEARKACRQVKFFTISVGRLSGTPGAVGFNVSPYQPVRDIYDRLTAATLLVLPDAPVKQREFHAHVAIAYSNSEVRSDDAIATVERLNALPEVEVMVEGVSLVLLERGQHFYRWRAVEEIPFTLTTY